LHIQRLVDRLVAHPLSVVITVLDGGVRFSV
jgi:hypothetical protein